MIERFEIKGIEGRRYVELADAKNYKISVSHSTNILGIAKEGDKANIEFSFTTNYLPIGMIRAEGKMLYSGRTEELMTSWNNNRKIDDKEIANEIMNAPMAFCITTMFMIAKELNLPPPLPMPKLKFEEKKEDKKQAYL